MEADHLLIRDSNLHHQCKTSETDTMDQVGLEVAWEEVHPCQGLEITINNSSSSRGKILTSTTSFQLTREEVKDLWEEEAMEGLTSMETDQDIQEETQVWELDRVAGASQTEVAGLETSADKRDLKWEELAPAAEDPDLPREESQLKTNMRRETGDTRPTRTTTSTTPPRDQEATRATVRTRSSLMMSRAPHQTREWEAQRRSNHHMLRGNLSSQTQILCT